MGARAAAVPKAKGLNCPNCGAALELRGFAHTLSVVCPQCLSILDARDPTLQILQQFQSKERIQPLIPLGHRGKLGGIFFEMIGFQVRGIEVEGIPYTWTEYLLFNPYKGFRYLTEYDGHWSLVRTLRLLPQAARAKGRHAVRYGVDTFAHFQHAEARTVYVMGEFPWQVRVGETVTVDDYIAPPRMLSSETTAGEVVWSLGEYMTGAQVWQAFQLPGKPPHAHGVYASQPSPHKGGILQHWVLFVAFQIMLALFFGVLAVTMRDETVFQQKYSYTAGAQSDSSFVTPLFELQGRVSNVELNINTNLDNNWAYFNFALINEATGAAYDFGREVSYYHGRDSDGPWTEGSAKDSVIVPEVPPGRYYLRVEPEMETPFTYSTSRALPLRPSVNYELTVKRDVPNPLFYAIAFCLLLAPPILATLRRSRFEKTRWQESDYGG